MDADRDLAILDFRKRLPLWRAIVAEHCERLGCAGERWAYHEAHVYCEAPDAPARARLKSLFDGLGLWASRFRFTHERRGEALVEAAEGEAREELMLGTHFLMPSALAPALAAELGRIVRGLGVSEVRTRVERVVGRSPGLCSGDGRAAWWEAHIAVAAAPGDVAGALEGCPVRDLSAKLDFVSGRPLGEGTYVNIEARGATGRDFGAACERVVERLERGLGLRTLAGLEEVLFDGPAAESLG
jgi:hypothetical protein